MIHNCVRELHDGRRSAVLKLSMLVIAVGGSWCTLSKGAVIVSSNDVASNAYKFQIVPTGIGQIGSSLATDANSLVNFQEQYDYYDGSVLFARAVPGTSTAEILIDFDFSNTSFRPNSVTFADNIYLFSDGVPQSAVETSSWSTDGTNFTPFEQVANPTFQTFETSYGQSETITLPQYATNVWYESDFKLAPNDPNGTFSGDENQWGRVATPGQVAFSASFAVVPEPATLSACIVSGFALAARRQRKAR